MTKIKKIVKRTLAKAPVEVRCTQCKGVGRTGTGPEACSKCNGTGLEK